MTAQLDTPVEAAAPTAAKRRRRLPDTAVLAGVLVALAIFFSTQSQFYLTPNNLLNILVNAAVIGIIAAPGTLLLVAGQFDLSVGSGAAFIGVIMAWSASQWGIPTAVLLSLAAGLLIGMINGFAVTVLGINALITTLATLAILRGLGQVVAGGQTLLLPGFNELGNARPFFNIPVPVLVFVAVIIVTALLMKFTVFGRSMYAIGANPVAMDYAEVYTGLQTGAIDAQDNPLPNDKLMKFYEVTNQIVLTGHNVGFGLLMINAKLFDSLTPEQQKAMQAAADEAFAWSDQEYVKQEAELIDFFKDAGLDVYTPDVDAFRAYSNKKYLESPLSKDWPEGMLDRINAL